MALSTKAKEILNRPDLIARQDAWFERLQQVFDNGGNEPVWENAFALNGIIGVGKHDLFTEPELWAEDCLEDLADRYEVMLDEDCFRPLCFNLMDIYGVHYVDKMFGAHVYYMHDQWYNDVLETPIGTLKKPDLETDEVWALTKRIVNAFLAADVALPLFSMPVIASVLNISVNLYGAEILMEMLTDPENAMKDLVTINDFLCELHGYFRSMIPEKQLQPVVAWARAQPPGYGQLCGCTSHLISGELYEEMIAPLDDKLLGVYPNGGLIHLCGKHTQHIKPFSKMKNVKAIQLNDRAADDFAEYYEGLRDDQVIYLNPSSKVSAEDAVRLCGGRRLIIPELLEKPIPCKLK